MTAEELLKDGQLSAAVEQLNQEVRSRPTDIQRRTFLFELLCFAGDCQRAERQLDVLGHQTVLAIALASGRRWRHGASRNSDDIVERETPTFDLEKSL
jgi:protein involved in temperature-dependent protein secretion